MARSDGTFPSYVKLNLDPDQPKAGWDDGARRCMVCNKDWPNISIFSPSPCCNAQAGVVATAVPHMTWGRAVKELMQFRFERYYENWNEGVTDEEMTWVDTGEMPFSEHEYVEGIDEIERLISQEMPR